MISKIGKNIVANVKEFNIYKNIKKTEYNIKAAALDIKEVMKLTNREHV